MGLARNFHQPSAAAHGQGHDLAEAAAVENDRIGVALLMQNKVGADGPAKTASVEIQIEVPVRVERFLAAG